MADTPEQLALGDNAARQLANATKTVPQLSTITPRWLVHLLQWLPVEAGIYRVNRVKNPQDVRVACSQRDEAELPQIFSAPLLHFGFEHLAANSLPFLVLGVLVRMTGRRAFWIATLIAVVASGLAAWLMSAPGTVTAGASGLVFGWLTYLLVRGLFNGDWVQILIAAAVFGFFGGMLWGVFPTMAGVSWQAHLGGVLGGVLAAWWLNRRPVALATVLR